MLLTILAEECAEVAQRVSKAIRFGLKEVQEGQSLTNEQRIIYEMNDLFAVFKMLEKDGSIEGQSAFEEEEAREKKIAKVEKYLTYSAKTYSAKIGTMKKRKRAKTNKDLNGQLKH